MTGTEIIRCTCNHPFQDGVYGKSNRVANTMRSGQLKCTVCGTISGSKGIVTSGKAAKVDAEPVVEKAQKVTKSSKAPMKGGDKDNRGRTKEKQSSKGKTVKPKAQDKSKKTNKK